MTDLTDKKEPTYYVSLTDYNEVKRMFIKANNDINKLKDLLKECRDEIDYLRKHYIGNIDHFKNNTRLDKEINEVLK